MVGLGVISGGCRERLVVKAEAGPLNLRLEFNNMSLGTGEIAAENGAFGGCFRLPFHRTPNPRVLPR
jgi:hypothetical protein